MSYLDDVKFKTISQLTTVELNSWLTEEIQNYSLATGYKPDASDHVFLYAVGQFQGLLKTKYKSWNCDEVHRVLMLSLSGHYGKVFSKPTFSQLSSIMRLGEVSRAQMYSIKSEQESKLQKNDKEDITRINSLNIGWSFIHWSTDNNVDPDLVGFDEYEKAFKNGEIAMFTEKWKNSYSLINN